MDAQTRILEHVAQNIQPGMLLRPGIGLPFLVAHDTEQDTGVFFQAQNGVISLGDPAPTGMEDRILDGSGGWFHHRDPRCRRNRQRDRLWSDPGRTHRFDSSRRLHVDAHGMPANWKIPENLCPAWAAQRTLSPVPAG
ncbi:hypothetical protein DFP92_103115 [Yoonia sediminilitoris]|uniref:Uncharacterized protein n=1 Tax=Yoonia sediminilitoris TaxID=1286148 RepID=A0A2T6KJY2_9RHOB|nr:hypothetical protein C8N45_103115 [Yoonia sediminilitoris]RCW96610.1 hypothetical protein DFP92_103115 [Yoonia sediminilitoris]